MNIEIKIKKGNVILYDRSVTFTDVPSEFITILKTVHSVELSIIRKD